MKIDVLSLDGQSAGSIELNDEIFGLEPRMDLIHRMVRWQLAKRRAGTHAVKNRAEIWRTGKKMYKQKGTGGARHGSARVPQFRGGFRMIRRAGSPDQARTDEIERSDRRHYDFGPQGIRPGHSSLSSRQAYPASGPSSPRQGVSIDIGSQDGSSWAFLP